MGKQASIVFILLTYTYFFILLPVRAEIRDIIIKISVAACAGQVRRAMR